MLSVELRNLWAKVIHAHRLRMGSSTIVRYFASQEFRVTPVWIYTQSIASKTLYSPEYITSKDTHKNTLKNACRIFICGRNFPWFTLTLIFSTLYTMYFLNYKLLRQVKLLDWLFLKQFKTFVVRVLSDQNLLDFASYLYIW